MTQINAYLTFNGNCREAMTFYRDCLGGELLLQPVKETPMAVLCPAGMEDHILHASLTADAFVIMASDTIGTDGYQAGTKIALSVNCHREEDIYTFFAKLSEGGQVVDLPTEPILGAIFGSLDDRYGIRWMLTHNKHHH